MYEFTSRVRFSEADPQGKLKPGSLVDYFQDCSVFHSIAIGKGPDVCIARQAAWMLTSWQIEILSMPSLGEEIVIGTQAHEFKRTLARRNFTLRRPDGTLLAKADSGWVFFDLAAGRPGRIPEEEKEAYGCGEALPMDPAPKHISLSQTEGEERTPVVVRREMLDTNGHLNNAQYVNLALHELPDEMSVRKIFVEYRRQTMEGEVLTPVIFREQDRFGVILRNADGAPSAVVLFEGESRE